MPNQDALKATNTGSSVTGWASGESLYYLYDEALDCAVVDATYNALSLAQKIAQSKTLTQLTQQGLKVGTVRTCGVIVTPNPETIVYNRALFIGNSILYHPPAPDIGWTNSNGMAASSPDNDWFHIVQAHLKTKNPAVDCRMWGRFTGTSDAEGGYFEANYWTVDLSRYDAIEDWMPNIIFVRLAENIGDTTHDLPGKLGQMIDKCKGKSPNCQVVVTNSVWGQVEVSTILKNFATARAYPFVDLFDMWGQSQYYASQYANAGVAKHPNDAGHAIIANRIIAKIPATIITPPTNDGGTTNSPATAYFANGFGEGSVEQLMQSAPFIPADNQLGGWKRGNTMQTLDNGIITFGIGKAIAGAIKHLGLSGGGKNWINTNFEQGASMFEDELSPDTGRSAGWSMYGTPGPWSPSGPFYGYHGENGFWSKDSGYDTGYNPVHGGSKFGDRAEITHFERRTVQGYGEVMLCAARIRMWDIPNEYSKSTYYCYWWLEGNAVRYYSIIDNQRDDNQMSYVGMQQEGPFVYTTADLWQHYLYEGDAPGTNGQLTQVNDPFGITGFYDIHNASEGWIASLNGQGNGVILLPQHNTRFMGGQFGGYDGTQDSNVSSYINSAQMMNYDVRNSTAFTGYIYAGNINNFRAWYNSTSIARPEFSWSFGQNVTCGWWSGNAPARFVNNRYSLQIGHRKNDLGDPSGGTIFRANGSLNSPFGAWKATDISTVYIKANWPAGLTNYRLTWKRSGRDGNAESSKTFSVSGSGSEQTIAISVAGASGWYGVIVNVGIALADVSQATTGLEEFVPIYIDKNNRG